MTDTKKEFVPIGMWGKDHWSLLTYLEVRCVDNRGTVGKVHMRVDRDLHPLLAHQGTTSTKYPTRLNDGKTLTNHDDWDCLEDIEAAGLIENRGTGINPLIHMTDTGLRATSQVRAFKARGGILNDFVFKPEETAT